MRWLALLACALAACERRPPVPILTWHAVGQGSLGYDVSREEFVRQLDLLRGWRFVGLDRALARAPHEGELALTFDDGSEDALTIVLPEVSRRRGTATLFVVTDLVADDEAHRVVRDGVRYLVWPELRRLAAAGFEIGSHAVHHRRLTEVSAEDLRTELVQSKRVLEARLGTPCRYLAWPFNAVGPREEIAARAAGYEAAFAGSVHGSDDPWSVYRYGMRSGTSEAELGRALAPFRR